jgi:hypothetical protein
MKLKKMRYEDYWLYVQPHLSSAAETKNAAVIRYARSN